MIKSFDSDLGALHPTSQEIEELQDTGAASLRRYLETTNQFDDWP